MEKISISEEELDSLIQKALQEDVGERDITTQLLFPESVPAIGEVIAGEEGVLCGIEVAKRCFSLVDAGLRFLEWKKDGEEIEKGELILKIKGDGRSLLTAERTALNFLSHLSGIATLTHKIVKKKRGNIEILDTRKTTPGLRKLEKYAVKIGGGKNHRMGLYDMVLIKDNHLSLLDTDKLKAIEKALRRSLGKGYPVEIEVTSVEEAEVAVKNGAEIVMLDNLKGKELLEAVKRVKEINPRVIVEVSGGINLENFEEFNLPGVNWISMGILTHSAPSLDFSLNVFPDEDRQIAVERRR